MPKDYLRQFTPVERLALEILYDLATKIPKVVLQRVEEVVPGLRSKITEVFTEHSQDKEDVISSCLKCVENLNVTQDDQSTEVVQENYVSEKIRTLLSPNTCKENLDTVCNVESIAITEQEKRIRNLESKDDTLCQQQCSASISTNATIDVEVDQLVDPITGELKSREFEEYFQNKPPNESTCSFDTGIIRREDVGSSVTNSVTIKEEFVEDSDECNEDSDECNFTYFERDVKSEITIQEHDISLQDVQDVSFVNGDVSDSTLASILEQYIHHETSIPEIQTEELVSCSSMDHTSVLPQITDVIGGVVEYFENVKQETDCVYTEEEKYTENIHITQIKEEIVDFTTKLDEDSFNEKYTPLNCIKMSKNDYSTSSPLVSLEYKILRSGRKLNRFSIYNEFSQSKHVFKCNLCPTSFPNAGTLKLHYEIHSMEQIHRCKICSKVMHDTNRFKYHIRKHLNKMSEYKKFTQPLNSEVKLENPYVCSICGDSFRSHHVLKIHYNFHRRKGKVHYKVYNNIYDLQKHPQLNNQPFKCVLCSKCFVDEYQFTHHLRLHCEERFVKCELCNKSFPGSATQRAVSNLKKESPYQCHIKSVSSYGPGRKPYTCESCSKICSGQ